MFGVQRFGNRSSDSLFLGFVRGMKPIFLLIGNDIQRTQGFITPVSAKAQVRFPRGHNLEDRGNAKIQVRFGGHKLEDGGNTGVSQKKGHVTRRKRKKGTMCTMYFVPESRV